MSNNLQKQKNKVKSSLKSWRSFFLFSCSLPVFLFNAPVYAQQVLRAIPVDASGQLSIPTPQPAPKDEPSDPPIPKAVPIWTPAPKSPTAKPLPTPTAPPGVPETITAAPTPPPPSASSKGPDVILLDYANNFYSRKLYDTAAPEYERYLSTYPASPARDAAEFRLGECYRAMRDLTSAKLAYQTVLDNFDVGEFIGPAAYRLAEIYLDEKDYENAENNFRKAYLRVRDPLLSNAAQFYRARCLENLSRMGEGLALYEQLGATKDNHAFREASLMATARLRTATNRKQEAIQPLEMVAATTKSASMKAEATVKIALLRMDLKQYDRAAADMTLALKLPEIGPWKEVVSISLLRVLYETGKYKPLIEQFNAAVNDYSSESKPEALLYAANSYRQLAQMEAALPLYEQLAHDFPSSSYAKEAQFERLTCLYNANDPRVAKEADSFLALNPDPLKRDQVVLLKAEALYKRQDYAGAAPIYACIGSSRLAPAFKAEALFKLGWCYTQLKQPEQAIPTYTEFLNLYPTHKLIPSALAQRAIAYQLSKNFGAALKDFNTLIAGYPNAKEKEFALQQKALTLGQQQDNAAMAETFKQLLHDYPKSPAAGQANYWIGWAAFDSKNYKNCIAPFRAAIKADSSQFFERAEQYLMQAYYCLEDRESLSTEVDSYIKADGKGKVPSEMLRWLGTSYFNDKAYEKSEKYFSLLLTREGESVVDDRLNLARSLLRQAKFNGTIKALQIYMEQVKEPFPRATGLLVLGEAQLGANNLDAAVKSADEVCLLQPEGRVNAEGLVLSGDILMARQQYEAAAKIYQKIAVVFDDPDLTPQALEKAWNALKKAEKPQDAAKVLNRLQSKYPEYQLKEVPRKF